MASRKRNKAKRVSRPKSRLSRVKPPRKSVKKHGTKRPARKQSTRRKSSVRRRPTTKHKPANKRHTKRGSKAATHRRKVSKHRKPLRKTPARTPKRKRTKKSERIERLERELRQTRETLRDLERTPGARRVRELTGDEDEDTFDIPRGAITREDSAGNIIIELPEYTGQTFGEIDWSGMDWDDVYDDVGDEDEDSYGEDAT